MKSLATKTNLFWLGCRGGVLFLLSLNFVSMAFPQWQAVSLPPVMDIPTSLGVVHDDADRACLTGEHNGVWYKASGSTEFAWTFVYPYDMSANPPPNPQQDKNPALGVVHIGRVLSAPSSMGNGRVFYALNHHNQFSQSTDNGATWQIRADVLGGSGNDPWIAMAIDPLDANHVWVGGTNRADDQWRKWQLVEYVGRGRRPQLATGHRSRV